MRPAIDEQALTTILDNARPRAGSTELALLTHDERPACSLAVDSNGTVTQGSGAVVNLWCAAKPVAGMALLALLHEHGFDPTTAIGDIAPELREHGELGGATVRELLGGCIVLNAVTLLDGRLADLTTLDEVFAREEPRRLVPDDPREYVFSEFSAWWVVARLIEALTARDHLDVLAERIQTARLDLFIGEHEANPIAYERVAVYLEPNADSVLPLLHDLLPEENRRWHLGWGGFGSAAGLADFYARIADRIDRRDAVVADRVFPPGAWLSEIVRPSPDEPAANTFQRLGLVSLDGHFFVGDEDAEIWGHLGWESRSVGGFDTRSGVAFGLTCTDLSYPSEGVKHLVGLIIDEVRAT